MRRRKGRILMAAAAVAYAAGLAVAAEQTILGRSLTVKQNPADATSRRVTSVAKETGSPNTLVGNPTLAGSAGGAILQVFAFGASSSNQTFVLAQGTASTGRPFWSSGGPGSFKYKDPKGDQGAVKIVSVKRSPSGTFAIKAKIFVKNGPVNIVPPNPGTSGCVALKLGIAAGAGDRYSMQFGPDSQISNSGDRLFRARKPSLEGVCPGGGPTTTTSTTTSTSSSTTTTPTTTTTTTTMYGSPSRAFLQPARDLLD